MSLHIQRPICYWLLSILLSMQWTSLSAEVVAAEESSGAVLASRLVVDNEHTSVNPLSSISPRLQGDAAELVFADDFESDPVVTPDPDPDPEEPWRGDDLRSSLEFLVSGPDARQQGFDPDSVDPIHTAALRGRTLLPGGAPLSGVEISVLGHPDWGVTMSEDDGTWTMVVGGGAVLIVEFRLPGNVVVQRSIEPAWNDWRVIDDVVLTPLDSAVTSIDLTANVNQLHTSSTSSDMDGSRAASLLFRSGTAATMQLPDGSVQPLDTLDVRATEVTVGNTGLSAMPAELPLGTLYTYAVDVTVDQAEAAGATRVDFDQPVTLWLDNFLDFPAGTAAPVGFYDRVLSSWVALDHQGIVADVIDVVDSAAVLDLDADGDNDVADQAIAAASGIDTAELNAIGSRHIAGDSIVRVLLDHFTPFDVNWAPDGEVEPGDERDPEDDERLDDETCEGGASSIIACNNGTLLEHLILPGAAGPLVYDSQRALGRTLNRTVKIPVTGSVVPTGLQAVVITVDVAGQRIEQRFDAPAPDVETSVTWDGLDVFGREVFGAVAVTVTHTELHSQNYASGEFGVPPASTAAPTSVAAREPTPLSTVWRGTLAGRQRPDGEAIGGWTLPRHHRYDSVSGTLHRGDGTDRTIRSVDRYAALWRLSGTGELGVGEPAIQTSPEASGVDVRSDGAIVVASGSERRIYLIDHDGLLQSFAGTGAVGDEGDGGEPTAATFTEPVAVAVLTDGSVLVVDAGAGRVRRAGSTIEAFAGAPAGTSVNGTVLATDYDLDRPVSVAPLPDGAVLIADAGSSEVLRVGADGRIGHFAGGGSSATCPSGCFLDELDLSDLTDVTATADGQQIAIAAAGNVHRLDTAGMATTITIGLPVRQVAFAPDGGLWLGSELGTGLIRKDGSLAFPNFDVQGTGKPTGPVGSASIGAAIGVLDFAVTSQGDVVLVDGNAAVPCPELECRGGAQPPAGGIDGIMVMTSTMRSWRTAGLPPFGPQVRSGTFTVGATRLIPSRNGSEIYLFDDSGRHLRTVAADTLIVVDEFGYDSEGRLVTHTDSNGRTTIIERDASGVATAVQGPEGRRTALSILDGLIASATDPLGRTRTFSYSDGLLVGHTDLAGNAASYEYIDGQLTQAIATDGTVFTITETEIDGGQRITVNTGGLETRLTEMTIDDTALSAITRQTYPDGSTRTVETTAGSFTVEERNGSLLLAEVEEDPRFGPLAQYVGRNLKSVGDSFVGDFLSSVNALDVTLADPLDPFSATQIVRSLTLDEFGQAGTWTTIFDPVAKTITLIDPLGVTTVNSLDGSGRVISSDFPTGLADTINGYDSDGRLVSRTVGSEQVALTYDGDGDLARVELGDGTIRDLAHDAAGRLVATTVNGSTTTYNHDTLDVLTGWTTPGGVAHSAIVTPAGSMSARFGPPNPIASRVYDSARRPVEITHGDGTTTTIGYEGGKIATIAASEFNTEITYETVFPSGNTTTTIDRTVRAATPASSPSTTITVDRNFDNRSGLPISVEVSYDRSDDGLSERRHFSNRRWSSLLATRREVDFSLDSRIEMQYNTARRLVGEGPWEIDHSGPGGTAASYQAALGGGVITQSISINEQGMINGRSLAVDGIVLASLDLETNGAGRVSSRSISVGGMSLVDEHYIHDQHGFLVSVTDAAGMELAANTFDIDGNRTQLITGNVAETTSFDVDGYITQHDGNPVSIDANGMVSSLHGWSLDHASTGELLIADDGAVTVHYGYDELGRRVARQTGNDVTIFLYGDVYQNDRVTDVIASDGTLTQYLYDEAGHVYAMRRAGIWYGVLSDVVGTPIVIVDDTGNIVKYRIFDMWGRLMLDSNPGFQMELGFAGGIHDPDTDLVRFGRRDYDPVTGRWLSPDPLHLPGGSINLYRYASNDPVTFRDPGGNTSVGYATPLMPGAVGILEFTTTDTGYSACFSLGGGVDMGPFGDLYGEHKDAGESQQASGSFGPFDIDVPLKNPSQCEVGFPFDDLDPADVDDLWDFLSDLYKGGKNSLVKTAKGGSATITQRWCSGAYAW